MDIDLQKLKLVDMKVQFLVFGFVKESQLLLRNDSSYWNISHLIVYTIMAYYLEDERFEYYVDILVTESNNKRTLILNDHDSITCYGNKNISFNSKGIHTWTFKAIAPMLSFAIGIDESDHKKIGGYFHFVKDKENYCYSHYGEIHYKHEIITDILVPKYVDKDIIEMVLNMNTKTLTYSKNGVVIMNPLKINESKSGYRMAVALSAKNVGVTLISYIFSVN
eukprot:114796_1